MMTGSTLMHWNSLEAKRPHKHRSYNARLAIRNGYGASGRPCPLVRQEFVLEPDESVQGGEHENSAGGPGDVFGNSTAHEVIRAGIEVSGGDGAVHGSFGGRAGRSARVPRFLEADGCRTRVGLPVPRRLMGGLRGDREGPRVPPASEDPR
jgi:hypothetical protein